MIKILIREPAQESLQLVTIDDSGSYFDKDRVLWDERSKLPMPEKYAKELKEASDKAESDYQTNKTNLTSRSYLARTDWYILRELETGVKCPDDIKKLREESRKGVVSIVSNLVGK